MQIVKGEAVCPVLRARRYIKAGRIWRVLRKLLGNGLILAEDKFGAGHRRCIGEQLAMQVAEAVVRVYTQTMRWQPVLLNLRRKPGLTNWPWKAIVERMA